MGKFRTIQTALNAGEISPKLRGRTDIPRYQHGLELCRNAIPMVWGGVQRMPGTRFVAEASGPVVRLIDFPVSIDGAMAGYVLELGDRKLRVYYNGTQIKNGAAPYEVATPYQSAILPEIRYTASANVLYFFHPTKRPKRFYRKDSDTNWILEDVPFTYFPYMRPPNSSGIKITPSATSGNITLTADKAWFIADHIGLTLVVNGGICTITAVTDSMHASASVDAGTPISAPDSTGRRLHDVVTFTYTPPEIPVAFGFNVDIKALYDGKIPDFSTSYAEGGYSGNSDDYLTVTPSNPLPDGVTVTRVREINQLSGTDPDPDWKEQAWSDFRGWPACATFHEQRMIAAGSPTYPTYEWGSSSGDPLDFTIGTLDSDGWAFNLSAASTSIYHLLGVDCIATFAGDKELTVRGSSDSPITPSNVQVKNRTPHGTGLVRPVQIGGEIYFVPPSGLKLRGFGYQYSSDSYVAPDVAVIADHLVADGNGISQISYAREPYSLLWAVTNGGALLTLTLDKEQEVTAWAAHGTDDSRHISITSVPGQDGSDQVWFAVKRLINGQWRTYVEMLDVGLQTDSSVVASGAGLVEISGLGHLENCLVDVKADGFYCGRKTVIGGKIALENPAATIEAGLPYHTTIKDLPLELANPGQSIQGAATAVGKIRVRLFETQGCTVNGEQIPFRRFPNINAPVGVFSGDKEIFNLGRGTDPSQTQVSIEQDLPFSLTVLAIIKEVTVNG
ncbi:hypothetical protein F6V25_07985 [Oryzomonas japonica]|uniref:Uncharacterized protein n=1 Tax=Oryzomonas japonica TaxID=2603858 RepID=A0A7J4ZR40_9BACT|nr:hypothetical protein [Oryzomonas japonica]KAB0665652.1 hypothetical protein F6V25_07985 [Oryzomonas japonica]